MTTSNKPDNLVKLTKEEVLNIKDGDVFWIKMTTIFPGDMDCIVEDRSIIYTHTKDDGSLDMLTVQPNFSWPAHRVDSIDNEGNCWVKTDTQNYCLELYRDY